ncbi:MAG TPA: glutamine amidotransferase [Clostridia bacterium]|nr:glutamine amidotransferase [Clostridia bacterium]
MLKILHLYPELLNLYSDRGNILTLEKRCSWRNIDLRVAKIGLNDPLNLEGADLLLIGDGAKREQGIATKALGKYRDELARAIENGLVVLAIGSSFQMLGKYFPAVDGTKTRGLSIFDFYTVEGDKRLTGDAAIELSLDGESNTSNSNIIVGFENHIGRTHLGKNSPLGRVLAGYGNNGLDNLEGMSYKNTFCTYLHGPLLPKNPELADSLILLALQRKGVNIDKLPPLNDDIEHRAKNAIINKLNSQSRTKK